MSAKPYRILWNVNMPSAPAYPAPPIVHNQIHTFPHISDTYFGKWPDYKDGVARNGGIPQLGDTKAHHDRVAEVALQELGADYRGIAALDFEEYFPIYDWNQGWHPGELYCDKSLDHAQSLMPNAPSQYVQLMAKVSFEYAATLMAVSAVQGLKSTVPNAKVGFYNYPRRKYWGGYDDPNNNLVAGNDRLAPLWGILDVLMPSLYLFYKDHPLAEVVSKTTIKECRRIRDTYNPKLMIYPYVMLRYHNSSPVGLQLLSEGDAKLCLIKLFDHGADGAVLWGNEPQEDKAANYRKYFDNVAMPLVTEFYDS